MVSFKNFQTDAAKHSSKINLFKINRNYRKETNRSEHFNNQVKLWAGFYRANPHRFVKDYLNIDLKLFQVILLWGMMHHDYFMYIGSRGAGKSFLSAVFLVTRCILYPETKVVIAAGVKSQAINVLLKIQDELRPKSTLLAREIKDISTNTQNARIDFHNGSIIQVVAATDNARSLRANLILVDEFRMVKKEIVDTVLRKFLTSPRKPKYTEKEEYKDYPVEENKEIYLSSAWYKHHWSYGQMRAYTKKMVEGGDYFVSHIPYQVGIKEGIYSKKRIMNEMTEDNFNEISWMMEMEAIWYGESEKAFFKYQDIDVNRKEPNAMYPYEVLELVDGIKNPKKQNGELRILSADIAMMGGIENDASIFSVIQLIPNGKHYERNVVYMEDLEGAHSEIQALRIQQLREDFEIDYLVIDGRGNGVAVIDSLMTPLYDEERGVKYQPITVLDTVDERWQERCRYEGAEKVMYIISATKELNMDIAVRLGDDLKSNRIKLLTKQQNAVEMLNRNKKLKYPLLEPSLKNLLILPYIQTEFLTHEMLNLETIHSDNGTFSLKEQGSMRKDRYTSVSYGNYYASILEKNNLRHSDTASVDVSKFAIFRKPKF